MRLATARALSLVLFVGSTAPSAPRPFLIAKQGAFPAISGHLVVWNVGRSEKGGGYIPHADVYAENLATGRRFAVVTGGMAAGSVAISKQIVVWVDCRHCVAVSGLPGYSGTQVYAKDLATGREVPLGPRGFDVDCPAISGTRVVWVAYRPRGAVVGEDVRTGQRFSIAAHGDCPGISGRLVVWEGETRGHGLIEVKNLVTGRVMIVSHLAGPYYSPATPKISGSKVIWTTWERDGSVRIEGKDLSSGRRFLVASILAGHFNPQFGPGKAIDGSAVVWEQARNPLSSPRPRVSIFGKVVPAGKIFTISVGGDDQIAPSISGHTVVWMRDTMRQPRSLGIYGAMLG